MQALLMLSKLRSQSGTVILFELDVHTQSLILESHTDEFFQRRTSHLSLALSSGGMLMDSGMPRTGSCQRMEMASSFSTQQLDPAHPILASRRTLVSISFWKAEIPRSFSCVLEYICNPSLVFAGWVLLLLPSCLSVLLLPILL